MGVHSRQTRDSCPVRCSLSGAEWLARSQRVGWRGRHEDRGGLVEGGGLVEWVDGRRLPHTADADGAADR